MACDYKRIFLCTYVHQKCSFYLKNANLLVCSDHKPLLKMFTGHTNNDKCNTWGLDTAAIPDMLKYSILKKYPMFLLTLSRLRTVGLYHDLDFKDHQQEFSVLFEPLPPVEQDYDKISMHFMTYQLHRWTKLNNP